MMDIKEYGIREFTNLHELDDEGNLITNKKGDVIREIYWQDLTHSIQSFYFV